jgi:predicted CXXCH cytochrome family protein
MMSVPKRTFLILAVVWAAGAHAQTRQSIVGSPHDLSVSGPGKIHALDEEEVCIFCHAPHRSSGQSPLWNRHMPPTHYRIYESSTTDARVDQPSGPSKMCLSCHDGALAVGLLVSRPPEDPVVMSQRTIGPGPSDLTQDLSDDHPIGFRYDRALASRDRQIKDPQIVTQDLPLGKHNEMHCTTCHDPHNNSLGEFLRRPTLRSSICVSCHDMRGWHIASHALSPARVSGRAVDPREVLPYHTVADNGCISCHKIHSAEHPERLLRFCREEENCLDCHNGSVACANIASEIRKPSNHPVYRYPTTHDPAENPRTMKQHVQCVDCHNPHAASPDLVQPPVGGFVASLVGPTMREVSGVDRAGLLVDPSRFEYEVCFKCHADRLSRREQPEVSRVIVQTNTRLEFQTSNPSFHPVIGPRNNPDVVSLIPPLRVGSVIKCTACHNSDQAGGGVGRVSGPHGSIYDPLLIDNYTTADFTAESPRAYALCYRCHNRQIILANQSFPLHNLHVVRARASCAACHDSHGISRTQGNSLHNSNLINFDRSIVQPVSGRIEYDDLGSFRGSCTLKCHGVVHVAFVYQR